MSRAERKILLMMSGSIACAKATGLVSEWRRRGHRVRVATTRSVGAFVGRATLEGLGAERVFDDLFASGEALDHIRLAQWADAVVVAPATSNLLAKLAAGIADDAVTALWQAAWGRGKPTLLAPAMNTHMWDYPATRRNISTLEGWGARVIAPGEGELACGERGAGRMAEPEAILAAADAALAPVAGRALRVLVTGGGTREPVDSVRYLGNHSTGRTAAGLVDALTAAGHQVTWLGAESAVRPRGARRERVFVTYAELEAALRDELGARSYDAVIHAAAVGDFAVHAVEAPDGGPLDTAGKLATTDLLTLRLVRNPKLLDQLRGWSSNPDLRVVGFKLTDTPSEAERRGAVARLFEASGVDAVVHNDMAEIRAGRHRFRVYHEPAAAVDRADGVALAEELIQWLGRAA